MCHKQTMYHEMVKNAVDSCEDIKLLDLVYKLLIAEQKKVSNPPPSKLLTHSHE